MIELSGISKRYATPSGDVVALDEVDLSVPQGAITGVIGPSGAGKSTLLRVVNLLERPTTGTVSVDGVELTGLSAARLRAARRRIGMIFQQFNLLASRTVASNVTLPLEMSGADRKYRKERVAELLSLVGLADKADAYPSQLSGGQQQRVGIARALAAEQQVLLCDEATSALDNDTTASILELLADLNQRLGLTILLITHEHEVVKRVCHRAALLRDGRIVEAGDVAELLTTPGSVLASELSPELPRTDLAQLRRAADSTLIDVWFSSAQSQESVVATLARRFELDLSIAAGTVDVIAGVQLGRLLLELPPGNHGEVLRYLDSIGLQPTVIADADAEFSKVEGASVGGRS